MTLRRMTLVGDAMSHAILPGISIAFVNLWMALLPLTISGSLPHCRGCCLRVADAHHATEEDASSRCFILFARLGVTIVSLTGIASIFCICFSAIFWPSMKTR